MPFTREGQTLGSVLRGTDPRVAVVNQAPDDTLIDERPAPSKAPANDDGAAEQDAPGTSASATDEAEASAPEANASNDDSPSPTPTKTAAPRKAPAKGAFKSALDARKGQA